MGVLKMLSDSLPVGGAVRAGVLAVSTVMAVIYAAPLMNATLSDKMKMPSKLF